MKTLCSICANSIRCSTWAEWKCKLKEKRIYNEVIECIDYKARGKDFKESVCQCEDCLKNEDLWDEEDCQ